MESCPCCHAPMRVVQCILAAEPIRKILEARLKRMRGRRGLRIVKPPPDDDDEPRGPWVN